MTQQQWRTAVETTIQWQQFAYSHHYRWHQHHGDNSDNAMKAVETRYSEIAIINKNRITMLTMKSFHTIDNNCLDHE